MTAQLAPGRRASDGLTKEQVVAHQRQRILLAMANAVAEKGYLATSVADVIKGAGVSRATFYEQFRDKADCFLAAFDAASEFLVDRSGREFDALIGDYLAALQAAPQFARVFLVDIAALGPEGITRRAAGQQRFAATIAETFGATSEADHFAAEALVAAVAGLVTARVAAGDLDGLMALHKPIVELAERMFRAS